MQELISKIKRLASDKIFWSHSVPVLASLFYAFDKWPPTQPEAKALISIMLIVFLMSWVQLHLVFYELFVVEKGFFDGLRRLLGQDKTNQVVQSSTGTFEEEIDKIITNVASYKKQFKRPSYCGDHFIEVLKRTKQSRSTSNTESLEYLSSIRREDIYTNLTYVRFSVWLIPTLGFIGTLLGMKNGVQKLQGITNTGIGTKEAQQFMDVISNFSTAFDATLYSIALSAILAIFLAKTEKASDRVMVDIDKYIVHEIISFLPNPIISDMEKQRSDFEKTIARSSKILESTIGGLQQAIEAISSAGQPLVHDVAGAGISLKNKALYGVRGLFEQAP